MSNGSVEGICVDDLLQQARDGQGDSMGQLLQLYRNYLTVLATIQMDKHLRRRMNPSDLVQEAMLAAHRDFPAFRGGCERELLAWLRQVLISCLHHAVEMHLKAKKRDVRREVPFEQLAAAVDRSAMHLSQMFQDRGCSPSATVRQRERAVAVADQLAKLKPDYRDVIVLRNLQGLSFEEIADRMDRKAGAVRMLWLRAIDRFKQIYQSGDF